MIPGLRVKDRPFLTQLFSNNALQDLGSVTLTDHDLRRSHYSGLYPRCYLVLRTSWESPFHEDLHKEEVTKTGGDLEKNEKVNK